MTITTNPPSDQREPQTKPNTSPEVTAARAGQKPGTVYLCGAGPGDPDLLTLRAARLLATCEVILPDDLVSDEILALANPLAEIIPVGKRCGQPRITQAGIHELMLHHARRPKSVLRLKSGDPLVFGRAGEEIDALAAAGIPFDIVPGITAAFAVAASLKTPLTDRAAASKLILATAHHSATKTEPVAWHGASPPKPPSSSTCPAATSHASPPSSSPPASPPQPRSPPSPAPPPPTST